MMERLFTGGVAMLRALVSMVAAVTLGHAAFGQHDHVAPSGVSSETPSWSPDGKRLAFSAGPALQHQIYVIDVDGRHARRLTSGEQNRWPAWSPDGKSIVFMSDRDGQGELYVMNVDGSSQQRLTRTPVHEFAPVWSPKGDAIAYLTEMPGGKQRLMVMRPDGSGQRQLDGDHLVYGKPSITPDGAAVLHAANREMDAAVGEKWRLRSRIYSYPLSGAAPTPLTPTGFDSNPTPAPEGRTLVIDTGDGTGWATDKGQWKLWMLDLASGKRTQLTNTPVNDWGAAWSPDGKWLAFSAGLNRTYALTIVAADGSGRRTLTRTDALPGER
jgi:TolB protein